ncbi:enoyl-CoA hydratase/isomerase family protein [Paraburkholderia sp. J67]|uniref:enoyl-CoA hydratase/isomerase family protein n=1 Tax=Paraburkholderia sp. J67 TaxID=2805435 RepID=UPI002ABD40D6|nr:enoyl-CoA hydratase-related protein [Paraburkholderia sp. J67]
MSDSSLLVEIEQGVATLCFNRPDAKNAMNTPMRNALHDAVVRIRADRSVRAVVLRGAGSDFCSGGDLRGMEVASAQAGRERIDDLHGWVSLLLDLDRPVIAAVDGVCYGAGFSFALAADFVIASTRARFCMPFMKVGLVPDCGAFYTLPRVVGLARARDLVFTAREIDAREAQTIGAVLEVVEPSQLHARAAQLAMSLAGASPVAFGLAKRALNQSLGSDLRTMLEIEAAAQGIAFTTDYHREAVKRFREKAAPLFRWPVLEA